MTNSKDEKLDYKRQRIKEARIARKIIIVILSILLITFVVGGYYTYQYIANGLSPADVEDDSIIDVEIPLGSSVDAIGQILEEHEVINNARIFKYYIKFKNESGFQAGEYKLSKSMTLDEIIESLKTGRILVNPLYTVTIPEGLTIEEIAGILNTNLSIDEEEFLEKMTDEEYIKSLIPMYPTILSEEILNEQIRYPLEGYLYASTYPIYDEQPTVEQIVELLLQQTEQRLRPYIQDIEQRGFTVHEAITMASLIEEEAVGEEDRKIISGVFYNRMNMSPPMPLQTDPTVLYALGGHKERVLYEDLEVDSPYNTYLYPGLPVGPIANFHENALQSALYPEEHDYLYFVASYEGDVHYAETYAEHQENIATYRPPRD